MAIFKTTTSSSGNNSIFQTTSPFQSSSLFQTTSTGGQIDLNALAQVAGVTPPSQTPHLSFLGRLGAGLSSLETGNAVSTALDKHSLGAGIGSYVTGVGKGIASAVTGRDLGQTEKKTYKDVVSRFGVTNGVAKFGLGLALDILLDPSTYIGSFLVKGAAKGAKVGTKLGLEAIGKVAPETKVGLELAAKGVKDAFGTAFKFGYGTSKGLPERTLETVGKIGKSKEGIALSNLRRLGTGTLSESQIQELFSKLVAGKRAEYAAGKGTEAGQKAALEASKSSDPVVQKLIDEQATRSQKFAGQAGVSDPFAVYFPGLAKDKIQRMAQGTATFRVGSEGWTKEFKNLLKDEEMIKNPAEAFARVEFGIARDNIIRSQLKGMISEFGKPITSFASEEEALKAGYALVKEKGAFGKPLGYMLSTDKKFIDNLISPEFATIDAIAKHSGYDAITSLFKRSVTGLFAPFHVRNYASGIMQNYEVLGAKALSPVNLAYGNRIALALAKGKSFGTETLEINGAKYSLNKVIKPFEDRFGTSSQYIADIADITNSKPITKMKSLNPLSGDAIHFRAARAVGNFIETQQKATVYITALRDGKSVKEALDLAARAGFDYRALTPFESKVLRRIIPFYSFTRKNLELQLRTLGEHPERINNIVKLMRDAGNLSPEERAGLPDYAKEQFTLKTGTSKDGLPEIATGLGSPVEQIGQVLGSNPIRRLAATLNPVFKVPLERAFGKDFFRDQPLADVVQAGEYAKSPQFIKDFLQVKEIKQTKKDGSVQTIYRANPYRLQLLRNLPTTRGASYVGAVFDNSSTPSKLLNAFTGVKPRAIDIETVQYFREQDRQKELENLLIQAGVLKRFERTYQPKNQTLVNSNK